MFYELRLSVVTRSSPVVVIEASPPSGDVRGLGGSLSTSIRPRSSPPMPCRVLPPESTSSVLSSRGQGVLGRVVSTSAGGRANVRQLARLPVAACRDRDPGAAMPSRGWRGELFHERWPPHGQVATSRKDGRRTERWQPHGKERSGSACIGARVLAEGRWSEPGWGR